MLSTELTHPTLMNEFTLNMDRQELTLKKEANELSDNMDPNEVTLSMQSAEKTEMSDHNETKDAFDVRSSARRRVFNAVEREGSCVDTCVGNDLFI